jgi:hypothetical protein
MEVENKGRWMSCLLIVYVVLEVSWDSFGEPRSVRVARDPASRSESILLVMNGENTELETSGLQMSPL